MSEYESLLEQVKQELECRFGVYGDIKAIRIKTAEEYDLLKRFYSVGHSPCNAYSKTKIGGVYNGPDWYFLEQETEDYGMDGKCTRYWTESLSEKKEKFQAFCAEYE